MTKQYKASRLYHPNFIQFNLYKDGEEAGGYIVPNSAEMFIKEFLKREGYKEMKENENVKI